jgi:thiamine pyrophosphokinase
VAVHAGEGVSMTGAPGAVLSLIALGGAASGITTSGLRWPLRGETLDPGSTRGVSNEIVSGAIAVAITGGSLLVVGTRPLERN